MSLDEELVRGFLACVPDNVYFKDRAGRYLAVSDSLLLHHGLTSRADILGRTDRELHAAGRAGQSRIDAERILGTGEPVLSHLEKREWTDGRVSWIVSTQLPLRGPDGGILGLFGVDKDVTAAKEAEAALEKTRQRLADASRVAGRAQVATGVLHDVGNVLNSLNVSASLIAGTLRQAKTASLLRVAELVQQQPAPLAEFLQRDPKGRLVPNFLISLARQFEEDRTTIFGELRSLRSNLRHIQQLVLGQQLAAGGEAHEPHAAKALLEDALRMNAASLSQDGIIIVRRYEPAPAVLAQRGKVLQILLNLIRNAHQAVNESGRRPKQLTLAVSAAGPDEVRLTVGDNGIGIAPPDLARLFAHGFTTRQSGHGFGLHTSAQAARDLGGSLTAASGGPQQGASFTLTLPARRTPPDPACRTPAAERLTPG